MQIIKDYKLPDKCMRDLQCNPLALIVDSENGFMCCGLNDIRDVDIDIFRHCFKNDSTDTMYDMSKQDLLSSISIFSMALNLENTINKDKT